MSRSESSKSSRAGRSSRRVILGSVVAAAALATVAGVAFTGTASAGPVPSATGRAATGVVRSGTPSSATDRVADFYGAYIDAVSADTGRLATDLRAAYLTKPLRARLAAWEAKEHADGVLRAQDVPVKWSVAAAGSATGHVATTVTLTWGTGPHPEITHLTVLSDTHTHQITAITPAP